MSWWRWVAGAAACLALLSGCSGGGSPTGSGGAPASGWKVACPHPSGKTVARDFDASLPCLSGGKDYRLGATGGKPLVVSLWASWCRPCRAEAPALEAAHRDLGDRLRVVGVNSQDDRGAALAFAEEARWHFPSVFDKNAEVMHDRGLTTLPAIFLVNADGVTVHTIRDSDLTSKKLKAAIGEYLKVRE
ncbi:MAG TPA: TlpA disulfide reductase family protein [Stackebrandtia sp.]|uniref:TlpA family protein disulfide reductase n=1 Tax=Stackebrandtia sp. TaxID=2023065 RepID=UPI002D5CCB03|nr:TlpA disulfide reductase family protein [Stackebrandtia sp.]HZE39468.1 TlpA disulfide reductase family protein [Stackebrandtia sp.]